MKLRDVLIGIVLFSLFIVASYSMMGTLYVDYGTTFTNNTGTLDRINNITVLTQSMETQTTDSSTSDFGFALGAWQAVKLMFQTPAIVQSMINEVAFEFGIPSWFISAFLAIAFIVILFAILSTVFRRGT